MFEHLTDFSSDYTPKINECCPFYRYVPKERRANNAFRKKLITEAMADSDLRTVLWSMCSRDILFYVNAFAWTFDPRKVGKGDVTVIPWVTYPFQDDALLTLQEVLGVEDLGIEKSRDMGASWMCALAFEHSYHFSEKQVTYLMVSRKEDLVDDSGNPDSLFWKIDFIHEKLPAWLRPDTRRTDMKMRNLRTGSTIDGESTNENVGRGGRRTAVLLDEFAAVQKGYETLAAITENTKCRIFNSTYAGSANAFYDIMQTDIRKLSLHWTLHPEKSAGLYYVDGKPRSPAYDEACKRYSAKPQIIAEQWDMDPQGADYQYFPPVLIEKIQKDYVQKPYLRGELDFDPYTLEPRGFLENPGGPMLLWMYVNGDGQPNVRRKYTVGADVATGTGSSNSAMVAFDRETGEKVLEYATPNCQPADWGRRAVVLCRWLTDFENQPAFLIWESNGPGRNFEQAVVDAGFRNFYYRDTGDVINATRQDKPGFWATPKTNIALMGDYRDALQRGACIERSQATLDECRSYVWSTGGKIAHSRSVKGDDPSGARENHADRVRATALAWMAIRGETLQKAKEPVLPPSCMQRRRTEWEQRKVMALAW